MIFVDRFCNRCGLALVAFALLCTATVMTLDAALGRIPHAHHPGARLAAGLLLLLAPIACDPASLRQVVVATSASVLLILFVFAFRFPLARSAVWFRFADWLKG